ncbi:hypothetical protein HMPREF1531_00903 [Propionibacterium sp. oral taxon 192 str. F0372]|uniref:RelA/SpoT domain-containing protein n=1 Tax=Propionibacterium sp. oral taxon 192 TaxID=671222 RepID=UPI000352956E|nr:RelA/SpoT domain-containing protein [Propionibacterium sp. oral taxon 192]EPH06253.1 hypothetical protein HMPREF1531_00903 [Propionibacterium sp. oral taxon 192 str. F0372]
MSVEFGSSPSKSQVERAGKQLRRIKRGEADETLLEGCLDVIERYRQTYVKPMIACNVAMRRFTDALAIEATVTQRLKRMSTIVEKLTGRESQMNLANMRDIAGVRVVVRELGDLRRLQDYIEQRRRSSGVKIIDYVEDPRSSGYRAVHLICDYGTEPSRPVEIQLRTIVMHQWAEMVEGASDMLGFNYKQDGNSSFHQWAVLLSRVFAARELDKMADVTSNELEDAWKAMLQDKGGEL